MGAASVVVDVVDVDVDVVDVDVDVVVVVVLINCFLSAEEETEAEADCWTDDEENEADTDELLDMVWLLASSPAGRETAKPASKQQTKAVATVNRLQLLLLDDVIFSISNKTKKKTEKTIENISIDYACPAHLTQNG